MEEELDRRVREALETPPPEREEKLAGKKQQQTLEDLEQLNSHVHLDYTQREDQYIRSRKWKAIQAKRRMRRLMAKSQLEFNMMQPKHYQMDLVYGDQAEKQEQEDSFAAYLGLGEFCSAVKSQEHYAKVSSKVLTCYASLTTSEKHEFFYAFTRNGFKDALRTGRFLDGSELKYIGNGKYVDKFGIVRDEHGPFWPADYGPLYPAPEHKIVEKMKVEPLTGQVQGKCINPMTLSLAKPPGK